MQQVILSRGDKVKIRSSSGEIVKKVVWDVREDCVLVCSDRQYEWLLKGDYRAAPIGFVWSDVVN